MKTKSILVAVMVVCVMTVVNIASATIIRGIDIDFVTIGNPGNPGDTRAEADPYGCGAVGYEYQIGMYEITNGQWDAFVSAAGAPVGNPSYAYDTSATFTGAQQPTNCVSWYEAAQFCNYLTSGDKSQGAYLFSGNNTNPGDFLGVDRASAVLAYGIAYVIPTEDEWYKAAYYTASGYSTYANGTDTAPDAGTETNYNLAIGQPWDIGSGTIERNGTFDMMGNIAEWDETEFDFVRGYRGGAFNGADSMIRSSGHSTTTPNIEEFDIGFRVASIVPEPNGPVAHWKFDEDSGTTAYDSAGSYDGDIYRAAWTTGRIGGALDFDGASDYVSVPHDAGLNITGDVTISAWVYFAEGGTGQDGTEKAIVTKCVGDGATNNPFDFRTANTVEQLPLRLVRADAAGHETVYSTDAISLHSWHHVLVRVEDKIADFYVDGAVTGKAGSLTKTPTGNVKPLLIGRRDDGLYLGGIIDDVRIYDRALSTEEVQRIYEGDLPIIVDLDIKPGGCPNPLNLASRGLLPVAILGTEDFDVNSIDPTSVRLEGVAPLRSNYEDVTTGVPDANECDCNAGGPDGYTDLTLKFKTQQVVAQLIAPPDEPAAGDELVLTLTGALSDGTLIEAEECVLLAGNVPRALAAMKSDITEDGIVNIRDFAVLAEYWLELATIDY